MNILISGFSGKMGQTIYNCAKKDKDLVVTEGFVLPSEVESCQAAHKDVKVFGCLDESTNCDVVIDFSHNSITSKVLDFCVKNKKPLVLATTGLTEEHLKQVKEASKVIPIFKSSNMSEGVFVLLNLIKKATNMLNGWDIEIVEKHHNAKKDAPSGTGLMMANEVTQIRKDAELVFGRNPASEKRKPQEIGIHAVRGGGYVGEHEIDFINENEVIKITHEAFSKSVFADGALKAAKFIVNKPANLYEMKNLFE
ncbi:MAG: 4-hydroxy-tetrahydrodipicolinate reductase [Clostridia bacterium]|nr:4-hydroxy-tetrahydrodipicolinate reductase [Clostridia bacterium]